VLKVVQQDDGGGVGVAAGLALGGLDSVAVHPFVGGKGREAFIVEFDADLAKGFLEAAREIPRHFSAPAHRAVHVYRIADDDCADVLPLDQFAESPEHAGVSFIPRAVEDFEGLGEAGFEGAGGEADAAVAEVQSEISSWVFHVLCLAPGGLPPSEGLFYLYRRRGCLSNTDEHGQTRTDTD
jgi:hypothetical protein